MNLIEICVYIRSNEDLRFEIYKDEIAEETSRKIIMTARYFGHRGVSKLNKGTLGKILENDCVDITGYSIERWMFVRDDENYNEDKIKNKLINSALKPINNRKNMLNQMEDSLINLKNGNEVK